MSGKLLSKAERVAILEEDGENLADRVAHRHMIRNRTDEVFKSLAPHRWEAIDKANILKDEELKAFSQTTELLEAKAEVQRVLQQRDEDSANSIHSQLSAWAASAQHHGSDYYDALEQVLTGLKAQIGSSNELTVLQVQDILKTLKVGLGPQAMKRLLSKIDPKGRGTVKIDVLRAAWRQPDLIPRRKPITEFEAQKAYDMVQPYSKAEQPLTFNQFMQLMTRLGATMDAEDAAPFFSKHSPFTRDKMFDPETFGDLQALCLRVMTLAEESTSDLGLLARYQELEAKDQHYEDAHESFQKSAEHLEEVTARLPSLHQRLKDQAVSAQALAALVPVKYTHSVGTNTDVSISDDDSAIWEKVVSEGVFAVDGILQENHTSGLLQFQVKRKNNDLMRLMLQVETLKAQLVAHSEYSRSQLEIKDTEIAVLREQVQFLQDGPGANDLDDGRNEAVEENRHVVSLLQSLRSKLKAQQAEHQQAMKALLKEQLELRQRAEEAERTLASTIQKATQAELDHAKKLQDLAEEVRHREDVMSGTSSVHKELELRLAAAEQKTEEIRKVLNDKEIELARANDQAERLKKLQRNMVSKAELERRIEEAVGALHVELGSETDGRKLLANQLQAMKLAQQRKELENLDGDAQKDVEIARLQAALDSSETQSEALTEGLKRVFNRMWEGITAFREGIAKPLNVDECLAVVQQLSETRLLAVFDDVICRSADSLSWLAEEILGFRAKVASELKRSINPLNNPYPAEIKELQRKVEALSLVKKNAEKESQRRKEESDAMMNENQFITDCINAAKVDFRHLLECEDEDAVRRVKPTMQIRQSFGDYDDRKWVQESATIMSFFSDTQMKLADWMTKSFKMEGTIASLESKLLDARDVGSRSPSPTGTTASTTATDLVSVEAVTDVLMQALWQLRTCLSGPARGVVEKLYNQAMEPNLLRRTPAEIGQLQSNYRTIVNSRKEWVWFLTAGIRRRVRLAKQVTLLTKEHERRILKALNTKEVGHKLMEARSGFSKEKVRWCAEAVKRLGAIINAMNDVKSASERILSRQPKTPKDVCIQVDIDSEEADDAHGSSLQTAGSLVLDSGDSRRVPSPKASGKKPGKVVPVGPPAKETDATEPAAKASSTAIAKAAPQIKAAKPLIAVKEKEKEKEKTKDVRAPSSQPKQPGKPAPAAAKKPAQAESSAPTKTVATPKASHGPQEMVLGHPTASPSASNPLGIGATESIALTPSLAVSTGSRGADDAPLTLAGFKDFTGEAGDAEHSAFEVAAYDEEGEEPHDEVSEADSAVSVRDTLVGPDELMGDWRALGPFQGAPAATSSSSFALPQMATLPPLFPSYSAHGSFSGSAPVGKPAGGSGSVSGSLEPFSSTGLFQPPPNLQPNLMNSSLMGFGGPFPFTQPTMSLGLGLGTGDTQSLPLFTPQADGVGSGTATPMDDLVFSDQSSSGQGRPARAVPSGASSPVSMGRSRHDSFVGLASSHLHPGGQRVRSNSNMSLVRSPMAGDALMTPGIQTITEQPLRAADQLQQGGDANAIIGLPTRVVSPTRAAMLASLPINSSFSLPSRSANDTSLISFLSSQQQAAAASQPASTNVPELQQQLANLRADNDRAAQQFDSVLRQHEQVESQLRAQLQLQTQYNQQLHMNQQGQFSALQEQFKQEFQRRVDEVERKYRKETAEKGLQVGANLSLATAQLPFMEGRISPTGQKKSVKTVSGTVVAPTAAASSTAASSGKLPDGRPPSAPGRPHSAAHDELRSILPSGSNIAAGTGSGAGASGRNTPFAAGAPAQNLLGIHSTDSAVVTSRTEGGAPGASTPLQGGLGVGVGAGAPRPTRTPQSRHLRSIAEAEDLSLGKGASQKSGKRGMLHPALIDIRLATPNAIPSTAGDFIFQSLPERVRYVTIRSALQAMLHDIEESSFLAEVGNAIRSHVGKSHGGLQQDRDVSHLLSDADIVAIFKLLQEIGFALLTGHPRHLLRQKAGLGTGVATSRISPSRKPDLSEVSSSVLNPLELHSKPSQQPKQQKDGDDHLSSRVSKTSDSERATPVIDRVNSAGIRRPFSARSDGGGAAARVDDKVLLVHQEPVPSAAITPTTTLLVPDSEAVATAQKPTAAAPLVLEYLSSVPATNVSRSGPALPHEQAPAPSHAPINGLVGPDYYDVLSTLEKQQELLQATENLIGVTSKALQERPRRAATPAGRKMPDRLGGTKQSEPSDEDHRKKEVLPVLAAPERRPSASKQRRQTLQLPRAQFSGAASALVMAGRNPSPSKSEDAPSPTRVRPATTTPTLGRPPIPGSAASVMLNRLKRVTRTITIEGIGMGNEGQGAAMSSGDDRVLRVRAQTPSGTQRVGTAEASSPNRRQWPVVTLQKPLNARHQETTSLSVQGALAIVSAKPAVETVVAPPLIATSLRQIAKGTPTSLVSTQRPPSSGAAGLPTRSAAEQGTGISAETLRKIRGAFQAKPDTTTRPSTADGLAPNGRPSLSGSLNLSIVSASSIAFDRSRESPK